MTPCLVGQRQGLLTGRTRELGGRVFHQVLFPWTLDDNRAFREFWGRERDDDSLGLYEYHNSSMISTV